MKTKKDRERIKDLLAVRDEPSCYYCGKELQLKTRAKRLPTNYAQIEHKLARDRGGSDDLENLVLSCKNCNRTKGNRKYDEFITKEYEVAKLKYETLKKRYKEL